MRISRAVSYLRERPAFAGAALLAVAVVAVAMASLIRPAASFSVDSASDATTPDAEAQQQVEAAEPTTVFVHVGGAVAAPGLYELPEGARVADAVAAAGGLLPDGVQDGVNLARIVADGEQIVVPSAAEAATGATTGQTSPGKVNINTADVAQLDELPGVGPATAEKIVADREQNGPFATVEDIKRVSGIGDKKYEELADLICV